ncbi:histone-fold-containing protein [Xylogone sp. PMI_703]|nr:histone-fold-containing protein [Xylogone sp. PMI_703]
MPYNTTAIPPRREPTGHTQLPLSRVKKIIALDNDINQCSNNAAFVITLATELFIQYLAEQAHNVVKSERKPRRNIQYRDLSNAVARHDNLEFLSDVVPRTVPYKQVKDKKPGAGAGAASNGDAEPGQTTLDGKRLSMNPAAGAVASEQTGGGANGTGSGAMNGLGHGGTSSHARQSGVSDVLVVEDGPNAQIQMEIRDAREHVPPPSLHQAGANGQQQQHGGNQDVEMS